MKVENNSIITKGNIPTEIFNRICEKKNKFQEEMVCEPKTLVLWEGYHNIMMDASEETNAIYGLINKKFSEEYNIYSLLGMKVVLTKKQDVVEVY